MYIYIYMYCIIVYHCISICRVKLCIYSSGGILPVWAPRQRLSNEVFLSASCVVAPHPWETVKGILKGYEPTKI